MHYIHIVALLALLQFFVFGFLVGRARVRYAVKAPAVTGNAIFERVFRVQMNTLEQLVVFLPALLIAGQYWSQGIVAGLGLVWLIGRLVYRRSYIADPGKRQVGFLLTVIPTFVLMILGLTGAVMR